MILCHCRVVNHRAVEAAVDDGARSVGEVGEACEAGTSCGGCWSAIADLIEERTGAVPVPSYRIHRTQVTSAA